MDSRKRESQDSDTQTAEENAIVSFPLWAALLQVLWSFNGQHRRRSLGYIELSRVMEGSDTGSGTDSNTTPGLPAF